MSTAPPETISTITTTTASSPQRSKGMEIPSQTILTVDINETLYHITIQKFASSTSVYLGLCLNNTVSFSDFYNAVPSVFDNSTIVIEILNHNGTNQSMEDIAKALCFVSKKPLSLLTDITSIDTFDATMLKNKLIPEIKALWKD